MPEDSDRPEDSDKRARGQAKFQEVMRFAAPPLPGDTFLDVTLDHLFAEVWARPGLSVRDRRIVTLTLLMTMGNEMTLRLHLGAAMQSGDLSDQELDELLLHVAHYAGWPGPAVASQVLRKLRAERQDEGRSG